MSRTNTGISSEWIARVLPPVLVAVAMLIHLPVLQGWWRWDDPQLILHALQVATPQTLFDPEAYRTLASHTFTPLLPISFKVDLIAGGINAAVAYAHQLIVLLLAGLLLDQLLRRYTDRWVSAFTSFAFLVSWIGVYAARTLMIRHYVEGLVAACAALILWSGRASDGSRSGSTRMQEVAGAVFWFVALLEKEIFLLLPLILVLQKRANGEKGSAVLRALVPPAVAAMVWLVWRWCMLGSMGGYATGVDLQGVIAAPAAVARSLGGPALAWVMWIFAGITIAAAIGSAIRRRIAAEALAVFVLVALVPVAPLIANFEWRYAFGIAVVLFSAFALAIPVVLPGVYWQRIAAGVVAVAMLLASPLVVRAYDRIAQPVEEEGRFLWENNGDAKGLLATAPSWYLGGIRDLKNMTGSAGTPRFVSSVDAFALGGIDPSDFIRWSAEHTTMLFVDPDEVQAVRKLRRSPPPMQISVKRDGDLLSWNFESERDARWSIITLPHYDVWPVAARGQRRVPVSDDPGFFVVKAEWVDGGWSASAELAFPVDGATTRWTVR